MILMSRDRGPKHIDEERHFDSDEEKEGRCDIDEERERPCDIDKERAGGAL